MYKAHFFRFCMQILLIWANISILESPMMRSVMVESALSISTTISFSSPREENSIAWKEDSTISVTFSTSTPITLDSSFIEMSMEDSLSSTIFVPSSTSFELARSSSIISKDPIVSSGNSSMTSNGDIISTMSFPTSNSESIVSSYKTISNTRSISTHIVPTLASDSSTVLSSTEILFNESSTAKKNTTVEFYTLLDDKNYPELYVGMRTTVTAVAVYPEGEFENVTIKVEDRNPGNFDVTEVSCKQGSAVNGSNKHYKISKKLIMGYVQLNPMRGFVHELIGISTSEEEENRQEICKFTVFFHNANGLMDSENKSLTATLKIKEHNFIISRPATFLVRTTVLRLNKTSFCELSPSVPKIIPTERLMTTSFVIRCWIPLYNPNIKIIISDESETPYKSVVSLYNTLERHGSNFIPIPPLHQCIYTALKPEPFIYHTLDMVNREYYYSNETEEDDILEFRASVTLSESAAFGVNYTFRIRVLIDEIQFLNTTVNITLKEPSAKETSRYTIGLHRDDVDEIIPTSNFSIFLNVAVPKFHSNVLQMNISTKGQAANKDSSLVIEKITYNSSTRNVYFSNVYQDDQPDISGNQGKAIVSLTFINPENSGGSATFRIELGVQSAYVKIGDVQYVVVETNNQTVDHRIQLSSALVYQDRNGTISSEVYKVLDKNKSSCIRFPVMENTPPLLLMKLNTAWLKINSLTYNVTVIGEYITSQKHGRRSLQVSTASSKGGFSGKLAFCELLTENAVFEKRECTYLCQCQQDAECGGIVIFIASQDESTSWSLCELIANNVV